MIRLKKTYPFALLLAFAFPAEAQQQPLISQYMMNKYLVNPAFAGATGYTYINLTARRQYSAFRNAPQTFMFSAETRLLEDSWILKRQRVEKNPRKASRVRNIGVGGYIFNDQNGIIGRTGIGLTYGYHINVNNSYQLSFGLSVSGYQFKLDDRDAYILDQGDPLLEASRKSFFVPDASTGIYISGRGLYGGLSASELFGSALALGESKYWNYHTMRHFNLIAGYKWGISGNFILEPSLLVRATMNTLQVEASTRAFYRQNYWIGFNYRSNKTLVTMTGFMVENFYIGYAYDASLGTLSNYAGSSHEIILGCRFGDNDTRRARWLRPDISNVGE